MALSEDQIKEYREAFALFDTEGKGYITTRELGNMMRALGQNPTEADLYDMIAEADTDDSGAIDFMEFAQMMYNRMAHEITDEKLLSAFRVFDRDNDGSISPTEMHLVMATMGIKFTDEEFNEMMAEVDVDNDGQVDFNEFMNVMKS